MISVSHSEHEDQTAANRLLLLISGAATYSWCIACDTDDPAIAAIYSRLACQLADLSCITEDRLKELSR